MRNRDGVDVYTNRVEKVSCVYVHFMLKIYFAVLEFTHPVLTECPRKFYCDYKTSVIYSLDDTSHAEF